MDMDSLFDSKLNQRCEENIEKLKNLQKELETRPATKKELKMMNKTIKQVKKDMAARFEEIDKAKALIKKEADKQGEIASLIKGKLISPEQVEAAKAELIEKMGEEAFYEEYPDFK